MTEMRPLKNVSVQVFLDDGILNTLHGDLEKIGVCSIGVVNINLTIFRSIEAPELLREVGRSGTVIGVGTGVVRKELSDRFLRKLLLEQVYLVEEQND